MVFIPLLLTLLAGLSTVIGGMIILFIKNINRRFLSFFLGLSAGAMIYLSFVELLPSAFSHIGFLSTNVFFFFGILFIGIIDYIVPHHYSKVCLKNGKQYDKLMVTGAMVMLGITIHNIPEGIAVFMSSFGNIKYGYLIAFATALHNIPEGIAVSVPIYFVTKNIWLSLGYSFLAGIAEPIGGLLTFFILSPFISQTFLFSLFAFIAGIMVFISFDELLPSCFEYWQGHTAIAGVICGMLMIAFSLLFI
jgi:ZIP family zinc transporter